MLEKITSELIHRIMNDTAVLQPSLDDFLDTYKNLVAKCPGVLYLEHNVAKARERLSEIEGSRHVKEVRRLNMFIAQCLVVYNLLVEIHNIEESDKMSGDFDWNK